MSQTWLTTGVTGKVRKCLAEQARPSQVVLEITPEPSVRTSASGHGRGERSGPRPWDTLAQRVSDTPTSPTSYSAAANFTAKSKNLAFFGGFGRLDGQERPRTPPGGAAACPSACGP